MKALDPVTLAVLNGRLVQIADEMDATLFRSAFNPIIAEAHDACHGLYHAETGATLVQGTSGLPIFVGAMAFAVKAVIDKVARDGDLEIEIVGQRALDQAIEHGILELLPPRGLERLLCDAGALRRDERRRRRFRRAVVGPDGARGKQRRETERKYASHEPLPTESTQRRRHSCR